VASWVAFTIYIDEFGLFRDVSKRELRIYTSERLAKYLFSLHYIPSKFKGVLLGPSLSDIIDTRGITAAPIYNLSITGGNVTELRRLFENVVNKNRDLKALILCVDPFITRKTGMEEYEMDSRLLWSSLGSTSTFSFYKKKLRTLHGKVSPDMSINTEWGRYHLIIPRPVAAREVIKTYAGSISNTSSEPYHIDPIAFEDLKVLVDLARHKNISILAYYHPYPDQVYSVLHKKFDRYKNQVSEIFGPENPVWDFNDSRYLEFRKDDSNYIDQVHLSDKGAAYISTEINRLLAKRLSGDRTSSK